MKTKQSVIWIAFVVFSLILGSCATKKNFLLSSVVPAARGYVKVSKDKNKNYTIKVKINNLAEAERLASQRSKYIVWMETADRNTKNIGVIKSSHGLLSKNLKASLETKTAFVPTRIFITAEDNPDEQYPKSQVVLSTDKF
jgi:hypothetical protein